MLVLVSLIILASYPMWVWQKQNKGSLAIFALIPAAIAAVSGIYQAIKGGKARRQAAAQQAAAVGQQQQQVNEANVRAQLGLPTAQYQQALQNITRNQAYAISNLQQRNLGVGAIGAVQKQGDDALLNLEAQNAAARTRNQQIADQQAARLIAMKSGIAQNNMDYGGALQAAGYQNIGNAAASAAALAAGGMNSGNGIGTQYNSRIGFSGMFGGNSPYNTLVNPGTKDINDNVSYRYNRIA